MTEPAAVEGVQTRGLWADAWLRLRRNRAALFAAGFILLLTVFAFTGPQLSPHAFDTLDWEHMTVPPGGPNEHWLGTDRLGRDLFVRTMTGVQLSLQIALLATLVSFAIGITYGAVAGFIGGRLDNLMMRFVDVLYSMPYIFIVIILSTFIDRANIFALFAAIGAVGWLTMARIVRGQTLSLRHREFIEAARASGVSTASIVARHIVPNVLGPVIVYATLTIPQMILFESLLSFLGLGVQEPQASLGSLITEGAKEIESALWMLLVPGSCLVSLLVSFNLLGDGLRDALDPRDR